MNIVIPCDFGDCWDPSTVWTGCLEDYENGFVIVKRPYCEKHKEKHGIHNLSPAIKYENEKAELAICQCEKHFFPIIDTKPE